MDTIKSFLLWVRQGWGNFLPCRLHKEEKHRTPPNNGLEAVLDLSWLATSLGCAGEYARHVPCRRESMFLPWHGIICPHRPVTAASGSSDPFARVESYWSEEALRTLPFWPRMCSPDPDHRVSTGSRPVQGNIEVTDCETRQSEWVGLRLVVFLSQAGHVLPVKYFKTRDSESMLCF